MLDNVLFVVVGTLCLIMNTFVGAGAAIGGLCGAIIGFGAYGIFEHWLDRRAAMLPVDWKNRHPDDVRNGE